MNMHFIVLRRWIQEPDCLVVHLFNVVHCFIRKLQYSLTSNRFYIYIKTWKSLSQVQLFVTPWTIQSMEFSTPEYWSVYPFPSPGALPNPGIELRSPALQADSLPAESQGKPKATGVGSLSLLQGIFPTQELNHWGLLHCRQILYQLRYQGSWYKRERHM